MKLDTLQGYLVSLDFFLFDPKLGNLKISGKSLVFETNESENKLLE